MAIRARRTWAAVVRLLERDERLFAFLLAVVMVGGLSSLGLALRPRHRIDLPSLVFWFAMYKAGILALVSLNPRSTRVVFSGALAVDLLLIFALLYLTGGGDSLFVNLFYPLVAVNVRLAMRPDASYSNVQFSSGRGPACVRWRPTSS